MHWFGVEFAKLYRLLKLNFARIKFDIIKNLKKNIWKFVLYLISDILADIMLQDSPQIIVAPFHPHKCSTLKIVAPFNFYATLCTAILSPTDFDFLSEEVRQNSSNFVFIYSNPFNPKLSKVLFCQFVD